MRVVIVGAGEVGTTIAASLAGDHNVIVIDIDPMRADELKYELDVLTLAGDGTTCSTLEEASVDNADLFIACTDNDQANLVASGTAKALSDVFTIARSKNVDHLRTWQQTEEAFGVDFLVCTDLFAAESVVRLIGLPASIDVDPFAGGLVQMAEFEVTADAPIAGKTIAEADRYDSLTFAGVFENGKIVLPSGDTRIEAGYRVVVIGSPESIQAFAMDLAPAETPDEADEIVVIGGSEIGYQVARLLENRGFSPRLVEGDGDRARWLAEKLPDTTVLHNDETDTKFLLREHIDRADVVVSALESDERNLLASVLAKRVGAGRVISIVDSADYVTLFEEVGIDVAVNPRQVAAEEIIGFSYETIAENIAVLEDDKAEVIELQVSAASDLIGKTIAEVDREVDTPFVIGAITRDGSVITPRGETTLKLGDRVVAFVEIEGANAITSLF
ncbi:Trk system potassium transporter TrkA [Halalkalirubrum salinum]|uniref:Trk system potassium transporter TrkA n=1 Tax=Halalkalirubrum salinum TaxID=2563889 RepID=UPI0010FB5349|nr:Trk system potassium transporter TrkA [Halalkalirubrum salinum]